MAAKPVPPDVVWSVAVLSFFIAMLTAVSIVNGPVVYVLIMERFGASREAASWVGSATSVATHLCGFAVTLLELRFSLYQVTLMGATLLWVGLLVSAFVPSSAWITFTLGIIHGGGAGVVFLALSVYVAAYFDKYRAIASGIKFGGWAVAGLFFPQVFAELLNMYGFIGVLVLCAAICMHTTPLIMLLKNPPIITFSRRKKQSPLAGQVNGTTTSPSKYCFTDENILQQNGLQPENHTKRVQTTMEGKGTSTPGKNQVPHNETEASPKPPQKPLPPVISVSRKGFWNVFGPLRKPIFYAFVPGFICCDYCEMASQLTLVDYALDKGWEREDTTSIMMCLSVGSLIGRLLLPLLADFRFITRTALMSVCYMACAAAFFAMPHVSSFHGVILLCVLSGATVGCAMSLKPVLMADYLGVDQIAPTMGVTGIIQLPLLLGNPAIVGFFRDKLGSYDNYYRFVAGINLFVAGTLLAFIVYEMRKKRAKVTFS